jgi:glutathione S-transferase
MDVVYGARMENNALTLYLGNKTYSSWSMRPWLVMRHVGLAFDEVVIPLDQANTAERLRAQSPSGRVPALRHGELVVWESLAICEYVAELAPAAKLWPDDRAARAVARAVAAEMHAGFGTLRQQMPMNLKRRAVSLPSGMNDPALLADIARVVALWSSCRGRFGAGGEFLFGQFTIADAMFAPVVTRFRSYAVALEGEAEAYARAMERFAPMREWMEAARLETWEMARYK